MSILNKYIIYRCSTCQRETEILLDARRPDPVRCNITLHCRGTLSKVGEKSSKEFLFTPLVPGLDDYIPRGQSLNLVPVTPTLNPISIFTGVGIITAAVFRRDIDPLTKQVTFWTKDVDGARLNVETPTTFNAPSPINAKLVISVFELTPALLKFKKYVYNVTSGDQIIRGIDDSPEGLNLRFDQYNRIKVILNGIELDPSQFDRSVDNQITMTPAITVQDSLLEIMIWDETPATSPTTDLIELTFVPLSASSADLTYRDEICWGDFSAADFSQISDGESVRALLYCLDVTELDFTKTYGTAKAEVILPNSARNQVNPTEFYIMLGKEPFLFQDKELNAFILGTKFLDQTTTLNFQQSISSGNYELVVDQELITQKYNPITPAIPVTAAVSQAVETSQVTSTEDLKRKYILGPS